MASDKDNARIPAEALIPEQLSIESLREAAAECKACDLWEKGTQTVFGEGKENARLMLVGEQPGDREDIEGHPFVGPAGRILDEALEAAGIPRADVYLTNAVKHFRWEQRGKRRLHSKPSQVHVRACRPWLMAELETVHPRLMVLLGATAAQSVMGSTFKVTQQRGKVLASPLGVPVLATVHPSSILRSPDDEARREAMDGLIADLKVAARHQLMA
jgi:DNA polymerase